MASKKAQKRGEPEQQQVDGVDRSEQSRNQLVVFEAPQSLIDS